MLSGSGHSLDTHPVSFFNCFGDSTEPVGFSIPKFGLCVDINDVLDTPRGYAKFFTHITKLSRESKMAL